jgi:hypothetical protein
MRPYLAHVDRRPGRPIGGCTSRIVPPHLRTHRVPDHIATANIHGQLSAMLGRDWYALVIHSDGSGTFAGEKPWTPTPTAEVMDWMLRLGRRLNRELDFSGHWLVAWHREQRPAFYFRDKFGVMQVEYGVDDNWTRLRKCSDDFFMQNCEEALMRAADLVKDLELRQMFQAMKYAPKYASPAHMKMH